MKRVTVLLLTLFGLASAQTRVQYGEVWLETSPSFAHNVQDRAVVLRSRDNALGMYIFCPDSRTANVSIFIPGGDFSQYGYRNGARVPVSWQADQRQRVNENWQLIGQNDDLRRYGTLGLITAELFDTKRQFTVFLFEKKYVFPASGLNSALRKLTCVVPFLRGLGHTIR